VELPKVIFLHYFHVCAQLKVHLGLEVQLSWESTCLKVGDFLESSGEVR
jgi:hypothetical protein